ncbi:hypothetical protein [Herbaspirillum sp. ST 5-3]|uniref:hypothetical protein n=1 Tax=Oxalobacteraceae TaxID=75682 RepID=UPI0010A3EB72|nr:hypothetical protein [Herbaspirillum sp. ST 5-3]
MSKPAKEWQAELRSAIQRRGRRKYDVWTGYAPKGGFYFSLQGTPNYYHLLWMEGDPNVVSYTIPSKKEIGRGSDGPQGTIPDAICTLRSNEVEWREVKTDSDAAQLRKNSSDQILAQIDLAEKYQAKWRLVTTADLNKHSVLIQNWRQGLAYIWSALDFDLAPFEYNVRFVVMDMPRTVSQVLASYIPNHEPLLLAAIFRLVQKGVLDADLSSKVFGLETVLYPRRVG